MLANEQALLDAIGAITKKFELFDSEYFDRFVAVCANQVLSLIKE